MASDGRKPEPETGISKVHFKLAPNAYSSFARRLIRSANIASGILLSRQKLQQVSVPAPGVNVDGDSSPDSSSAPVLTENRACSRREDAGERSSVRQRIKRIGVSDGWE